MKGRVYEGKGEGKCKSKSKGTCTGPGSGVRIPLAARCRVPADCAPRARISLLSGM